MSSDRDTGNAGYGSRQDHVDHILDQWSLQRPDLDVSPMGIIGRISRLSRFLEHSIAEVLARHGLNEPQFAVLAALRRAAPPVAPFRGPLAADRLPKPFERQPPLGGRHPTPRPQRRPLTRARFAGL